MIPLNIPIIVLAACVAFIIGFLWHGPLFGKQWMKVAGIKEPTQDEMDAAKKTMWKPMLMGVVSYIVMAFVLAHSIYYFQMSMNVPRDWMIAFNAALWNWIGFVAVATVSPVLWEKKTWSYWMFSNAYFFAIMLVMSAIITFWG